MWLGLGEEREGGHFISVKRGERRKEQKNGKKREGKYGREGKGDGGFHPTMCVFFSSGREEKRYTGKWRSRRMEAWQTPRRPRESIFCGVSVKEPEGGTGVRTDRKTSSNCQMQVRE